MTCAACGANNPAAIEFCEVCGAPTGTPVRRKTELASPPDAGRKGRTLYDPGPPRPEASPSDVFAHPAEPRSRFDPQDPFKSSIVPGAVPLPARAPATAAAPAAPVKSIRHATVLRGPAPVPSDLRGVLCIASAGEIRLVPLMAGRTAIGRDDGMDVQIDDPNVSGSHAFLYVRDSGCSFIDVSRNGSIVDGAPIMGEDAAIVHGTVIELGQVRCTVLLMPSTETA